MRRIIILLLACILLLCILSACVEGGDQEMTAVPIGTEKDTEPAETTEAADEETAATEDKRYVPAQATAAPTETPTEAATEPSQTVELTQTFLSEDASTEAETEAETVDALRSLAESLIGSDVSVLYAAIGYPPNGSVYSSVSVVGYPDKIAENGTLYYDDFTVYTYRIDGTETVVGVS